MTGLAIRAAGPEDAGLVLWFIRALAEYEKLLHECVADEELVRRHLFGDTPRAEAVIAELDGEPAGFALYFHNFSTFLAKPGLYVEDVFVKPEHRGRGIGRALFSHLAGIALARGCGRMEWWVLDWNAPAIGFYRAIGARAMEEWTVQRLTGPALEALARGDRPA